MSATNISAQLKPVAIAPVYDRSPSTAADDNGDPSQSTMPYTCQTCAKRKIKCDKATPICSSCRKGKLECFYQAPAPRRRKRRLSGEADDKLARYERILHQHGLLSPEVDTLSSAEQTPRETISLRMNESETSCTGKILAKHGKTRYIDSYLWRNLGDDELRQTSDDGEDHLHSIENEVLTPDPLTGAFIGSRQSLRIFHPTYEQAMTLWKAHIENVEPICKILHIPTTFAMIDIVSQQPEMASMADECLLFAIYHFAVLSMTEEDCALRLGHARAPLMHRYHFAVRQALVNASFLKTTDMPILQALVLFLLACRYTYDSHTYWILTGVAVRIAQRMGLHRDGEKQGLSWFDVQMRRRLFYQIIPLDGIASQMSGTGIAIMPETWDTEQPLNLDDDQIWPGMTEKPQGQKGATEMIFCLARASIGKYIARAGKSMHGGDKDYKELDLVIDQAESEVEEKYIRYCDIVSPLHFLTIGSARAAIAALRSRARMSRVRNKTATEVERRELFEFSKKILDTDIAAHAHAGLKNYSWHMKSFFLWGTWDSLIFILDSLYKLDLLSSTEVDTAWARVGQIYNNHNELVESRRALQVAVRRLTLKAWDVNPSRNGVPEPAFIQSLRSLLRAKAASHRESQEILEQSLEPTTSTVSASGTSPGRGGAALFDNSFDDMGIGLANDFGVDTEDWMFWDKLIQDYQTQSN